MWKKRKKAWRGEEAKQRKISSRKKNITQNKYKMKRWKILHSVFYISLEWIMYVSSYKRVSLRPCSTFISLSRESEKRMLLGYNKTRKIKMKNRSECLVCGDGSEKKEDEVSEKRERSIRFSFCVCWSFSISFYTFAPVLAAVAGCMREQNRNYVDCEKTEKMELGRIREIKFNYKLKIVGNQKDGKGKQHTWKEEKRFRAPQWDLCEMMGMRWRKILLSDSIARRRAAAITDNVRKKKEMVKNDICDVTLALRRVERAAQPCPTYTQTR